MGENLDLVREAFEAFRRGGLEATLEYADPNIECLRAPPQPDVQTYHGIDGVRQMYADWTADFEEFEMEPLQYIERGERVFVEMLQRGTGRASGVTVDGHFWLVFTVERGKITRQDSYLTWDDAEAAASRPA
jgi:ketosteroid isomerase-like protein